MINFVAFVCDNISDERRVRTREGSNERKDD